MIRLLFLAAPLLIASCGESSLCGNEIKQRLPNQDTSLVAYVYTHDCGATTGFVTMLAIGRRDEDPSEAQVVFSADDRHGGALTEGPLVWMRIIWRTPHLLRVAYAEHARVFKQRRSANGATITYRATGPYQQSWVTLQ